MELRSLERGEVDVWGLEGLEGDVWGVLVRKRRCGLERERWGLEGVV